MLEGWLALGLDPRSVSIFDPKPAPEIQALAAKGIVLNPASDAAGKPAVVVLAVKPQIAPDAMPSVVAACRQRHARDLHHGRQDDEIS